MRVLRKFLSVVFIIVGIGLVIYPKAMEIYRDSQQEELIDEWESAMKNVIVEENDDAIEIEEIEKSEVGEEEVNNASVNTNTNKAIKDLPDNMEGMISIEKIDLKLPILPGASQDNMKKAIGSLKGSASAGQVGNYSLAGHRNLTFGRNFNRLDELSQGDLIKISTGQDTFNYRIKEKLYVKPSDIDVLKANGKDKEITLITCHPLGSSKQRLIIKGTIE